MAQQWIQDVASGRRCRFAFAALHLIAFGIGMETVASFSRAHPFRSLFYRRQCHVSLQSVQTAARGRNHEISTITISP
jgi:hypothetical protein